MRQLNVTFEDEEYARLKEVKSDRNWREAIKEEFGI